MESFKEKQFYSDSLTFIGAVLLCSAGMKATAIKHPSPKYPGQNSFLVEPADKARAIYQKFQFDAIRINPRLMGNLIFTLKNLKLGEFVESPKKKLE